MLGDIIAYAIFGFVVGALARFALPGRRPMGCLATIVCGLIGSFVGGLVVRLLTGDRAYKPGWIASVIGAMLVVWLYSRSHERR